MEGLALQTMRNQDIKYPLAEGNLLHTNTTREGKTPFREGK